MSHDDADDAPAPQRARRAPEEFAETPERKARLEELTRRAGAREPLFDKPRKEESP